MSSYTVVRSEPRLTAGGWQATVEAGQVLTVGEPESFNQDVADYLVEHGALTPCDALAVETPVAAELAPTPEEPAGFPEPESIPPVPEEAP